MISVIQVFILIFLICLGIIIFAILRKKFQNKFEIAIIDVVVVAFIASIYMLNSGKITSLKVASLEIEAAKENAINEIQEEIKRQREISSLWIKVLTDEDLNSVLEYLEELEEKEKNNWLVYDYRGSIYYAMAQKIERYDINKDAKEEDLLMKSKEAFIKSYQIRKAVSVLNIIKISAELDNEEETRKWIEIGIKDKVVSYKDIIDIVEIYRYAKKDWFQELSKKSKSIHENDKIGGP